MLSEIIRKRQVKPLMNSLTLAIPQLIRTVYLRAKDALRQCLPEALKDQTFAATMANDESVQKWLSLLLKNLSESSAAGATAVGGIAPPPALSKPPGVAGSSAVNYAEIKRDAWN
jgi:hypothetical protein